MRPIKAAFLMLLLGFPVCCFGQPGSSDFYSSIRIDTIPALAAFQRLTAYETHVDSATQAHNQEFLQSMLERKAFIAGTLKGFVDSAIQEQRIKSSILFRENRSRYWFQDFRNGQLADETNRGSYPDSLSTECSCFLNGDTLKIQMGIWVFGGFAFSIKLVGNKFTGRYWLDEHKDKIFKLDKADTLSDNILIPFAEQQLVLDSFPTYKLGQQLTGLLRYKTVNYLRAADFEDWNMKEAYSDEDMDIMHTKGTVRFTCRVRPMLEREKE